ncbi:transposase IS116/IS110/IS902 family protein [Paenibacillus dendritiformis C454]|uniref:Transposase IS116/IS110/IS902 family protein n=1 Tax=Paenibacillus dendritiformis C454 TaxID=1131935 RepID=H3SIU5_9BACL|nr:transposase IS116/IS110/IS902 family protein [Paenibacillus dendritiformis C454]
MMQLGLSGRVLLESIVNAEKVLSPGNNENAGKKKSSRTMKGNRSLKAVLSQAAWAANNILHVEK